MSTGALTRFFGSTAIKSQGGREVDSGGSEGSTSHSSTGVSTSLYGEYMSQQLVQSCSCGNTFVPPGTREVGVMEEVPV